MVQVADLATVVEQDAVALPVEAVGQDDLALGAGRHLDVILRGEVDRGGHAIAELEVELALVGRGQ